MSNNDLILTKSKEFNDYDISFNAEGDFSNNNNIQTAILISILDDRRADISEITDPLKLRGWIGNEINLDGFEQGSKLWLLSQKRITEDVKNQTVEYVNQSLQWMLQDDIITTLEVLGEIKTDKINTVVIIGFNGTTTKFSFNLFESSTNV